MAHGLGDLEGNIMGTSSDMNRGQKLGAGILGGGLLGGGLWDLFGSHDNPADAAMGYLNKIPAQTGQYLNPYINQGKQAGSQLQGQYDSMTGVLPLLMQQYQGMAGDPSQLLKKLGSGYQQSPGFQWQLGQGEQAINNANAAGGMLGTPQHQQQAAELAGNLANQDYNQYLTNALGLQGAGLQGMQGLFNQGQEGQQLMQQQGFEGSKSMADQIAALLGQQGQYAYAGKAGQNQTQSSGLSDLFSGLGGAASFLF